MLLIPHVRAAHVGRYTCEASNAAGTARVSATLVARGTAARDPSCPAGLLRRHSTGFGLSSVDILVLTRPIAAPTPFPLTVRRSARRPAAPAAAAAAVAEAS